MLRKFIPLLLLLMAFSAPVLAQDAPTARVEVLPDLVGSDHFPRGASLSPDGLMIVWIEDKQICEYNVSNFTARCITMPDGYPQSTQYFAWSPDSKTVAFTQDFFQTFREPDLYTLDTQTLSLQNRTDDHSDAGPFESDGTIPADVLPAWSTDNQLYFWRSFHGDLTTESVFHLGANNTPEDIQNLALLIPGPYGVYQQPVISPDGTTMAFLVRSPQAVDDARNGVYTVNLKTGGVKMIVNTYALRAGTPSWVKVARNIPTSLYWSGSNLVVNMGIYQMRDEEPSNAVYVDVAAKTVTPLFDVSAFKTADDFASAFANGQPASAPVLRTGVVSGDGQHYFFLHRTGQHTLGYSSLNLPPDGSAPTLLGTTDDIPGALASFDTASVDGSRVLLEGKLFTLQP